MRFLAYSIAAAVKKAQLARLDGTGFSCYHQYPGFTDKSNARASAAATGSGLRGGGVPRCRLFCPFAIKGDELDDHFGFPVREAVETVNNRFKDRTPTSPRTWSPVRWTGRETGASLSSDRCVLMSL
jgi:hypothetical protein